MSAYTGTNVKHLLCKEPDAGKPHVRICGGRSSQGVCLPDEKLTLVVFRIFLVMNFGTRGWYNAFSACLSLTQVTLPDGLKTIDSSAFAYCSSPGRITIPDSMINMGDHAFYYCEVICQLLNGCVKDGRRFRGHTQSDVRKWKSNQIFTQE